MSTMLALRRVALAGRLSAFTGGKARAGGALVRRFSDEPRDLRVELLKEDLQGIAVFAMNRPAARNALSRRLMTQMEEGLAMVQHNTDVRVVVLTSDVPGAFCAGADLKERAAMREEEVGPLVARARRAFTDISELRVPVIAALDGLAYGGGLELALAADIRVAAEDTKMGLVETRLAIIPGGGGTQRLPRLVGLARAKELIFTARVLTGREAADIGLVEHAVAQNDKGNAAYVKALGVASEIITKGPVAVSMAKLAINSGMQADLNTGMKIEGACYAQVIPTTDRMEGLKAFKEKRKPVFEGK